MDFIIDPSNNQSYSIFSKHGKYLLKTYVSLYQSGGAAGDGGGGAGDGDDGAGGAGADAKEVESTIRVLAKTPLPQNARGLLRKILGHKTQNQPENEDQPENEEHLKIVNAFTRNNPFFDIVSNIIKIPLTSKVIDLVEIIFNIILDNPNIIDKFKGTPENYGSIKIVILPEISNTKKEEIKLLERDDVLGNHFNSGDEVAVVITDIINDYEPFVDDIFDFIVKISKDEKLQNDIELFLKYEVEDTDSNRIRLSLVIDHLKIMNVEEPLWSKFYDSFYFGLKGEKLHNFIVNLFKPNLPYWKRFSELF